MLLIAAGFLMSEGVRRRALAVLAFGLFWSGLGSATAANGANAASAASAATANATNAPANASSGATNPAASTPARVLTPEEKRNGRALYDAGEYAAAQEAFNADLAADRESAERAFNLGAAAYKNKQWAEAIDAFGKAILGNTSQ